MDQTARSGILKSKIALFRVLFLHISCWFLRLNTSPNNPKEVKFLYPPRACTQDSRSLPVRTRRTPFIIRTTHCTSTHQPTHAVSLYMLGSRYMVELQSSVVIIIKIDLKCRIATPLRRTHTDCLSGLNRFSLFGSFPPLKSSPRSASTTST